MKKVLYITIIGLFVGTSQVMSDNAFHAFHAFASTDGRSIDAMIVEYNAKKSLLQIERRDGERVWVAPGVFSEMDRAYILEWIEADKILSPHSLRLSMEKKTNRYGEHGEWVFYEIDIKNRTGGNIEGVMIEYRYFMKLSSNIYSAFDSTRVVSGKLNVGRMDDGSGKKLKTKPVRDFREFSVAAREKHYDVDGNETIFDHSRPLGECRVKGIWFRIYGPSVEGVPTYRDLCDPIYLLSSEDWDEKRSSLKDDFSFSNLKSPQSEKRIMSLEEVEERGRAETSTEYNGWMSLVYKQFCLELSIEEQRELIDGVTFFYNLDFDDGGGTAAYVASKCRKNGWLADAVKWYEIAMEGSADGDSYGVRRALINLYACSLDSQVRNGSKAVKLANILVEEDKKDPRVLDLLARAYAANDQFGLAVKTQKYAVERFERTSSNQSDLVGFKERLELYKQGTPYLVDTTKGIR